MGRHGEARNVEGRRLRRNRRDLDESRRLARRQDDRLRPARRHLHDADHRRHRDAHPRRRRVRDAAALLARRQAHRVRLGPRRPHEPLDDGPDRKGSATGLARNESAKYPTPRGLPTASTSSAANISATRAPSARARCGSTTSPAAAASSSPIAATGSRTRPSRSFHPTDATSTSPKTSRPAADSSTTAIRTARSTSCSASIGRPASARTAIGGAGSALRPQLSPDGKTMAFVRRVGRKSVLLTQRHGERSRARSLGRARSRSAGSVGDLRHVSRLRLDARRQDDRDLGAGEDLSQSMSPAARHAIPFTAHVKQTITDAVRFPQQVAPDSFDVKMLRWVTVSPDQTPRRLHGARQAVGEGAAERCSRAA